MRDRTLTRLRTQLAGQLETAFATEVDVDQRDVWPQLGDLPARIGRMLAPIEGGEGDGS